MWVYCGTINTPRDFDRSSDMQQTIFVTATHKMLGFTEVYTRFLRFFPDDVIAMRKNKFYFLVFVSLIIWAIATYYLFLHKPTSSRHVSEVRR